MKIHSKAVRPAFNIYYRTGSKLKHYRNVIAVVFTMAMCACGGKENKDIPIFDNGSFAVFNDSITEGYYRADVTYDGCITSNFNRCDTFEIPETLHFTFAINGDDNELGNGLWHSLHSTASDTGTVFNLGRTDEPQLVTVEDTVKSSYRWHIKLDMRRFLHDLNTNGYYTNRMGDTIFNSYFKGIWIHAKELPFHNDINALRYRDGFKMKDRGDSIYEAVLTYNNKEIGKFNGGVSCPGKIPEGVPTIITGNNIINACYRIAASRLDSLSGQLLRNCSNLSVEEIAKSVWLTAGVFDNGKSERLLKRCVENGRIKQFIGSPGKWPMIDGHLMWIVAAYELYKVNNDKAWLKYLLPVARKTLKYVETVQGDATTGLLYGGVWTGKTFEHNYPSWMTYADIFDSQGLTPNIVYYMALKSLQKAEQTLGNDLAAHEAGAKADAMSERIVPGFWIPNLHILSKYTYCRPYSLQSHSSDNQGQALSIISGICPDEMSRSIVKNTPQGAFGIQRNFPAVSSSEYWGYSGNVTDATTLAFWALASANAGNMRSVEQTVWSLMRSATFSTFNGMDFNPANGSIIMDDTQKTFKEYRLCAAICGTMLRTLCGFEYEGNTMKIYPNIPAGLGESVQIDGIRIHDTPVKLSIKGSGNSILGISDNGVQVKRPEFSYKESENLQVVITLSNKDLSKGSINMTGDIVAPHTPSISWKGKRAEITNHNPGLNYFMLVNGVIDDQTQERTYTLHALPAFAAVQFQEVNENHWTGAASKPKYFVAKRNILTIPAKILGVTGTRLPVVKGAEDRYVELSPAKNLRISFSIKCRNAGNYMMFARYANGAGSTESQSRCVNRTIFVNGNRAGTLVLPCNGEGNWVKFSNSNHLVLKLEKGLNEIIIEYKRPYNNTAVGSPGTALLEWLKLIRL